MAFRIYMSLHVKVIGLGKPQELFLYLVQFSENDPNFLLSGSCLINENDTGLGWGLLVLPL